MSTVNNDPKFTEPPILDYTVMVSLSDKTMPEGHPY